MQAIILSAGAGNRLRPLTEKIPKCLVEVNGTPIIFNALKALLKCNVQKVIMVVGYLSEVVKKRIGDNWGGMEIVYVENELYAQTNNIYSLWLARNYLNEDTILMECDIFFEEKLIERLISQKIQNTIVVDHFKQGMDGTVVEVDENKRVVRMIPGRDQGDNFDFSGKYKTVNVYYFSQDFLLKYFVPNLELYIKTQSMDQYYELILAVLIYLRNPSLYATVIDDIKWIEIDDFSDLQKAEYLFSEPKQKLELAKRIHGGYWRYNFKDYSYLYNLYFPPTQLINELRVNLKDIITNYPSGQKELARILSNWVGVKSDYLAVANGASEIIRVINKNLVKKLSIPAPTFNEYERGLDKKQTNYFYKNPSDFKIDLDKYIRSVIDSQSNTALLINPNNPTSQFNTLDEIEYLLSQLTSLDLFVLDESFIDFASKEDNVSMIKEFEKYRNLIIVKSMSKNLGVAGLRLGYAVSANTKLIKFIRKELPIWNINSFAEFFLESLPKYRKEYENSCKKVIDDRDYLYREVSNVPKLKAFPPKANFVLVELEDGWQSDKLVSELFLNFNILIKDCSNKTGLENRRYIRISARTRQDTDILITAMRQILCPDTERIQTYAPLENKYPGNVRLSI